MTERRNPFLVRHHSRRVNLIVLWGLFYFAMVILGFSAHADDTSVSDQVSETSANPFPLMQPEFTPLHEDEYATTKFGDLDGFFSIISNQPLKLPAFEQAIKKDVTHGSLFKAIIYISKSNPGGSIGRPENKEPFCMLITKAQVASKTLDGFFFLGRFKKQDGGLIKQSYFEDYSNDLFNISCDPKLSLAEIREFFSPGAPDKFGFLRQTGLRLSSVCEYVTDQIKPGEMISTDSPKLISDECKKLQPVWVEKAGKDVPQLGSKPE